MEDQIRPQGFSSLMISKRAHYLVRDIFPKAEIKTETVSMEYYHKLAAQPLTEEELRVWAREPKQVEPKFPWAAEEEEDLVKLTFIEKKWLQFYTGKRRLGVFSGYEYEKLPKTHKMISEHLKNFAAENDKEVLISLADKIHQQAKTDQNYKATDFPTMISKRAGVEIF